MWTRGWIQHGEYLTADLCGNSATPSSRVSEKLTSAACVVSETSCRFEFIRLAASPGDNSDRVRASPNAFGFPTNENTERLLIAQRQEDY